MTTATARTAQATPAAPSVTEALYTICPVLAASNVADELGWLDEEFRRVGAKATYLRFLPDNAGWLPHYTHGAPNLFRDGGAIPTIQARADLADTKLVALTWAQTGGQLLARAGAGIHRTADLRGRRVGLFKSLRKDKIDFQRGTAQRSIELALGLAGLGAKDVEIVDIEEADDARFAPARKPVELWSQYRARGAGGGKDLEALLAGRVDAIFGHAGRARALVASGEVTVIEDLGRHPDWTLQVANGPFTTAVSADFAEAHPEVVVAWLRAAIRAGRWINANKAAAAEIFARVTVTPDPAFIAEFIAGFDFVPDLSPRNLRAIELEKDFLRSHGYVKNDFDVKAWADPRFLAEAHASLAADAAGRR
jgi:ABC-type nitrate/sulfonate/bicarbonate transport system substrate-binding protein